ncbi:hypothetical protein PLUTE_a0483 [Pseudoalteromonas luteoviolacea DSM 6061]|nr:hypothetical protein [Pseudoalteromonas luteoviolacea DSM 6061]
MILLSTLTLAANVHAQQLTYQWEFGDGNVSTEENPNHEYTTPNFYTVTLKAFANQDLSYSKQYEVDAVTPAIKSLTLNLPDRVEQGKNALISVNLESDYDLNLSYKWKMPNGEVISGKSSDVIFQNSGQNRVELSAYFNERLVSEQTININVLAKEEPTSPPSQGESDSGGGSMFWLPIWMLMLVKLRRKRH